MMPRPSEPPAKMSAGRAVGFAIVLLPAVAALAILARWFTPLPIIDDYWHIFAFALGYLHTAGQAARVHFLLFDQVGPYKLVTEHALVLLQLGLLHRLDFAMLIVIGNAFVFGLFVLFVRRFATTFREAVERPLVLLPLSLLIFSLNYAETVDTAIQGIQQPAVIFFSLASLFFLSSPSRRWWPLVAASVCGVLASATYANGMLVWPVGMAMLWMGARGADGRQKRNLAGVIAWLAVGAATSAWYLRHYSTAGLAAHNSLWSKGVFFLMFLGGGWENMHHRPIPYLSLALGIALFALFVHATHARFYRRNPFFFFSAVWIVVTALAVAEARIAMGLQLSLSSRYKIYCDLLMACLYPHLFEQVKARFAGAGQRMAMKRFLAASVAVTCGLAVTADAAGAKYLRTRRARAEAAMRSYLADPQHHSPMFLVEGELNADEVQQEDTARQELNEAIALGIYTPPKR